MVGGVVEYLRGECILEDDAEVWHQGDAEVVDRDLGFQVECFHLSEEGGDTSSLFECLELTGCPLLGLMVPIGLAEPMGGLVPTVDLPVISSLPS